MVQVAHTSASFRLLQVSCHKPNWKLRFSSWLWQVLLVRQQVLPWLRFPKPPLFHWRRHQADPGHFWHNCSCSLYCQKIEGEERWWKWHFRLTPSCATLQGNMTFAERYSSQNCAEKANMIIWKFCTDGGRAGEGGHARRAEYGLQVLWDRCDIFGIGKNWYRKKSRNRYQKIWYRNWFVSQKFRNLEDL